MGGGEEGILVEQMMYLQVVNSLLQRGAIQKLVRTDV